MKDENAEMLRRETLALISSAGLDELLRDSFGDYALVGSAALDLMTWRDIDLYVPVDQVEAQRFVDVLPPIFAALTRAGHTVIRVIFNDEWTVPRGSYGSGYYWGLRVRATAGAVWKIDLWGWHPATFRRKLEEHRTLEQTLATADRNLILSLKTEAQQLPGFRRDLTSWDIYRFVLADAGTTLADLRAFVGR